MAARAGDLEAGAGANPCNSAGTDDGAGPEVVNDGIQLELVVVVAAVELGTRLGVGVGTGLGANLGEKAEAPLALLLLCGIVAVTGEGAGEGG